MTSKYTRKITKLPVSVTGDGPVTVELDVYDVLAAWEVTNPAIQHAVKKLLMPGARGAKSKVQDIEEALVSIKRALELEGGELTEITPDALAKIKASVSHIPPCPPRPPAKTPRIATPREIVGSIIAANSPRAEKLAGFKAVLADSERFKPVCRDDADALELAAYYISQTELRERQNAKR